jgi:hypothetical protein
VGVHSEEMGTGRVDACNDKISTNVTLVAEQVLLQHRHASYHAGLASGGEGMKLEVGGNDGGGELGISGGSGTCAPDLGGYVVELLAIL